MTKPLYRSLCLAGLPAMLALLAVSCDGPTTPTPPPPPPPPPPVVRSSGPIAFTSNRDGSDAIYLANADGSAVTRLAAGAAPAWSPDGRQIAFHRFSDYTIHVINADGSGLRYLTQGLEPSWSPDGGRLVFIPIISTGITVIDVGGSNRREVIDFGEYADSPVWSPDGGRIAFTVGTYVDVLAELWGFLTINPDGSGARRLRELDDANEPAWSPDGSEIAFVINEGIGVARADGSGRRLVVSGSNFELRGVEWTPDGRLIYSRGTYPGPMRIFVNAAGPERQLVPDVTSPAGANYRDYHPSWSKSGR